jgi:hypothetical protein
LIYPPLVNSSKAPSFYVNPCEGWIYYVSISRAVIHLGVHLHLVGDGRCRATMYESRKLIEKEVDWTLDAKTFAISLNTIKSFLAKHMFNKNNDDSLEVIILNKFKIFFLVLSSLNVWNLVASFKHHYNGGYIDNILELKSKNRYDYIEECCFLGQISSQKVFLFKMSIDGVKNEMGFIAWM